MINNNVTNQLLLEVRVEKQLSPGGQGVVDHLLLVFRIDAYQTYTCVVTSLANITYCECSQSVIRLRAAFYHAIIGLIT